MPGLQAVHWRLLHAAVDLGASPMRAIANTLLPQMRLAMAARSPMFGVDTDWVSTSRLRRSADADGILMGNLVANFFSSYLLPAVGIGSHVMELAMVILIVLILFPHHLLDPKDIYV